MTDYRVIHMEIAVGADRAETSAHIEKECDNAAREGWYLNMIVPDLIDGTTRGLWLIFAAAEDEAGDRPIVAAAAEILSKAAEDDRPLAGA
jgi:hypothetical protein